MAVLSEHPYRNIYPHELQNLRDVDVGFSWDHADSVVMDCMSWSAGVWSCRIGSPLARSVVFFLPFTLYFDFFYDLFFFLTPAAGIDQHL
jgi:hypothetical protein